MRDLADVVLDGAPGKLLRLQLGLEESGFGPEGLAGAREGLVLVLQHAFALKKAKKVSGGME